MSRPRDAPGLDVYLLPAVVGGGLGDIEEVLLAGRILDRAGFPATLLRLPGRPLPRSVEGPWAWPAHRRVERPDPRHPRALTLSAWWGVSAAPDEARAFGRGGPWSEERAAIERAYAPGSVLHVSFEEFARTLTSREQCIERLREGGIPLRDIRRRSTTPEFAREVREFHDAFVRFRAFGRRDVLHLYPTFRPARAFQREFPAAVQTAPFWPERVKVPRSRRGPWVWYASPASSTRLAADLARHWPPRGPTTTIAVRAPSPFPLPPARGLRWARLTPEDGRSWRRRLAAAPMRVVTGSRTLLEALVDGGPFLYYNGTTGAGRSARRHRPEKVDALLDAWARLGLAGPLLHDLAEFSRGRAVGRIAGRARDDRRWRAAFPHVLPVTGFRPPYDDAERLLVGVARALATGHFPVPALVHAVRSGLGPPSAGGARSA